MSLARGALARYTHLYSQREDGKWLAAAIGALVTPPARATNFTWDGNFSNLWDRDSSSHRTNWDPQGMNNPIPNANDNVFFHGDKPYRTSIDLNGNRRVPSAEFWGGYDYTLGPSTDTLTLVDGDITASGGATHEIAAITKLEVDGVWDISGANTEFWVTGLLAGRAYRLKKTGTGTLELTGGDDTTPSSLSTLTATSGVVLLDGARIDLTSTDFSGSTGALLAKGGDITIRSGADVQMAANGFGMVNNNTLTITGSSSVSGGRLDAAEYADNTGSILVEDSASLGLDGDLIIGNNGDGDLTVQTGASASADWVILGSSD